ncbi:alpha/beta fold hydrolase [Saccharopolyspora spinosporotrichia]
MADHVEFGIGAADDPLRAWHTGLAADQPALLLCPGLGAIPGIREGLLRPVPLAHAMGWNHRGGFGTPIERHVDDGLAVLDALDVKTCTLAAFSAETGVAAEFARRYPDRVRGLLLVGGIPGSSVDSLAAALGVPEFLRRLAALAGTSSLRMSAPLLESVLPRIPTSELSTILLQHSGFMLPGGETAAVTEAVRGFLGREWRWYLPLLADSAREWSLEGLDCPVTVLAGRYDVLSDLRALGRAVAPLPQARLRVLDTSHFVPFEAPDALHDELALLLHRVQTVECARLGIDPPARAAGGSAGRSPKSAPRAARSPTPAERSRPRFGSHTGSRA